MAADMTAVAVELKLPSNRCASSPEHRVKTPMPGTLFIVTGAIRGQQDDHW